MRDGKNEARHYTFMLLDLVRDGMLDRDNVITAFASYMSEADVHEMMRINDMIIGDIED